MTPASSPWQAAYARRHNRGRLGRPARPWYVLAALGQPSTPPWRNR